MSASESLRVGLVAEGPTDRVVFEQVIARILSRPVSVTMLQPTEKSLAFSDGGASGFGWRGVLNWCDELRRAGGVEGSGVLTNLDLLLIHLDGDVARDAEVNCAKPCPPAADTANALRALLLARVGAAQSPPKTLLAIPMDATECWLLPLFRPRDPVNECDLDPASRFCGGKPKLLEQSGKKKRRAYEDAFREITWDWSRARALSQAARFEDELRAVAGSSP